MIKWLSELFKSKNQKNVEHILSQHYGGIYKRIDENREMVELLKQKYPSLFVDHFWVEGWLKSQDGFLNDLAKTIPKDKNLKRFNVIEGKFPRPWPKNQ